MSVSAPDSKFRILLVDDDEGMRSMVRLYIDVMVEGVEWSEASDGQHALEAFRELKPDLVITDVNMPRMDGFAFVKEIEALGFPLDRVVIQTARVENLGPFDLDRVAGLLHKPYPMKVLLDKVINIKFESIKLAPANQPRENAV